MMIVFTTKGAKIVALMERICVRKAACDMTYTILNIGCDDETECDFDFTEEEYRFLKSVFERLNENSHYGCMPKIYIDPKGG